VSCVICEKHKILGGLFSENAVPPESDSQPSGELQQAEFLILDRWFFNLQVLGPWYILSFWCRMNHQKIMSTTTEKNTLPLQPNKTGVSALVCVKWLQTAHIIWNIFWEHSRAGLRSFSRISYLLRVLVCRKCISVNRLIIFSCLDFYMIFWCQQMPVLKY
jgi:hypothetical protein